MGMSAHLITAASRFSLRTQPSPCSSTRACALFSHQSRLPTGERVARLVACICVRVQALKFNLKLNGNSSVLIYENFCMLVLVNTSICIRADSKPPTQLGTIPLIISCTVTTGRILLFGTMSGLVRSTLQTGTIHWKVDLQVHRT